MTYKLKHSVQEYYESLSEEDLINELAMYGLIDKELLHFSNKLDEYTFKINQINFIPGRGSGKTLIFDLLNSIYISYNSFTRHLEYLKYTNKSVKRNSHIKALSNIEKHLDKLINNIWEKRVVIIVQ